MDLAIYLLKLPIEPDSLEVLQTEHQRVEDRRADLVVKLRETGGEAFILHIEIRNNNDDTMALRMLRYGSDILLAHPGLPLRQYVIYIGADPLTMRNGIEEADLRYRYGLLDMRAVDCRHLLEKDTPDALVLASCATSGIMTGRRSSTIFIRALAPCWRTIPGGFGSMCTCCTYFPPIATLRNK